MGKILTDGMELGTGGGSSFITVVQNYSALPDPTTVAGQFYWAEESQGTKWLPAGLGGTFYNSGMYYSDGTQWTYQETPFQASQAQVNIGTSTTTFVTPATLHGWDRIPKLISYPIVFDGSKNTTTTNSYLKIGEVFSNLVPVELPRNVYLNSISASTDGAETWTAEVHANGSLIAGGSLSLTAQDSGSVDNLAIPVTSGTQISLYCNGNNIKRPRILVTFKDNN